MIPIFVVIALGVSAYAGRKAHDAYADHPALRGYCSHCGETIEHGLGESGANWKKSGALGEAERRSEREAGGSFIVTSATWVASLFTKGVPVTSARASVASPVIASRFLTKRGPNMSSSS